MGTTCISQKQREQSQYTQSRMQRLSQESYRTIRQCVHLQKVQIPEHYDEAIECETPSVELPNSNSNEMQLSPRNQCDSYQLIPVSDTTRSIRFHSDRDIVIQQSSMHLCVKTESFIQNRNLSYQGAYKIERVIGIGGQGTVYKVKSKNGNLDRAMKQISKIKHGKKAKSMREMEILMKLDHPHIIRAIELYQDDRHFYMITELLQGGDLQEDIQGQCFSETKAATIIVQILLAISYLHNQDIVHRDIKPENILYSTRFVSSCVKLIDFGLAQQLKSSKFLKKKIGTFYYMAPEIFQKHYGKPVDMWAIGVLLFYMIAGKQPFYGVTEQEVLQKIQTGTYHFDQSWSSVGQQCKHFITSLLMINQNARLTIEQAFNHPWIQQHLSQYRICKTVIQKFEQLQCINESIKLVLVLSSHYLPNIDDCFQVLNTFYAIDSKRDGVLDKEELISAFLQICDDKNAAEQIIKTTFQMFSRQESEVITYSEFLTIFIVREKLKNKKLLKLIFDIFDQDLNDYIDEKDFQYLIGSQKQQWTDFVNRYDKDRDNQISFIEFEQILN